MSLRGLALMCAVLLILGLLALLRGDKVTDAPRRPRTFVAADGADVVGGRGSGDAGTVPVLPLFPTTSTTKVSRTSTSAAQTSTTSPVVLDPPAVGTYGYAVSGTEASASGGQRALPGAMTLVASKGASAGSFVFDMRFSDQHVEQAVVAFRTDGISLSQETRTVTFLGTRTQGGALAPAVAQVVWPATAGASRSGASTVRDGAGRVVRTEDWKVVDTAVRSGVWEVTLERTSRPGAIETLHETRHAFFDTGRRMWTKWETHLHTDRPGELAAAYDLDYTATLTTHP